ncbi:MAG: diphosphomevalonate decarboxylase [Pseudomonadota bacterium]
MSETAQKQAAFFAGILPLRLPDPRAAVAFAPSNIALGKYWGKRDDTLNLPCNSSLSVSLGSMGTTTKVSPANAQKDEVIFNERALEAENPFASKILRFTSLFRQGQTIPLRIETENSIPTAAGLASSASGFAALVSALDAAFSLDLPKEQQSCLARIGSGSATRSFWQGFVRWDRGNLQDGTDSYAVPLHATWPEFRIAIIPVDTGPKSQSSRDGMNHTVSSSPLFSGWPGRAEADCKIIEQAIMERDFVMLGETAEANALAMHATMMAARPALCYLKPESWRALETLWSARKDGLQAYATMDAGANVKLIFLQDQEADIKSLFPNATIIEPFRER